MNSGVCQTCGKPLKGGYVGIQGLRYHGECLPKVRENFHSRDSVSALARVRELEDRIAALGKDVECYKNLCAFYKQWIIDAGMPIPDSPKSPNINKSALDDVTGYI